MTVSPNTEIIKYYKMFSLKRGRLLQCLTILIRGVLQGEHFVVFYYLSVW
jgi:hypothetical protein